MQKFVDYLMKSMDVSHCENDYADEVTCSKCSRLLHQPVTALCGHSFCKKCSKTSVTCRHCKTIIPSFSFTKNNVVLSAVIEHYFPKKNLYLTLMTEGDELVEKNLFHAAVEKYTEASVLDACDSYAFEKLAVVHNNLEQVELALANLISAKFRNRKNSAILFDKENFVRAKMLEKRTIGQAIGAISAQISNRETAFLVEYGTGFHFSDWSYRGSELSELEDILVGIVESNIFELENNIKIQTSSLYEDVERIDFKDGREEIEENLACALCTRLFYEPVCTPCGHTFCSECLQRCLDHRPACPLCQASLDNLYQYLKCNISIDWSLDSIIKNHLPILYKQRELCQEKNAEEYRKILPLFVCAVVFPFVITKLHVFEPHYRLMLRRAMKFNGGKFGVIGHRPTKENNMVGTVLEIKNITFLACGRSIVTSVGTKRFQILEHDECDGYIVATKIRYHIDEEESGKIENELFKVENNMYNRAKDWYDGRTQNYKQVIKTQCGNFPEKVIKTGENGPYWMWWIFAVIPANDEAKLFILRQTSVRKRLSILYCILKKLEITPT